MTATGNNVVSGPQIRVISRDPPTPVEQLHQQTLHAWCENTVEPEEESERRRAALEQLRITCKAWIRRIYTDCFNWPADDDVGGILRTTGSYRYNAHTSGSDIDVVLLAPARVTLNDFITSLPSLIRALPGVTDMIVIPPPARVPLITFRYHGIDFDLSFGSMSGLQRVPDNIDILNDRLLIGLTAESTKAANAVRVADLLIKAVPDVAVFRHALRFVKLWAKARGIYSFKIGFPSGIGWAILTAKICQCYPGKNGAGVLFHFFSFFSTWFRRNPTPTAPNNAVFLTASHEPAVNLNREGVAKSWNPRDSLRDSRALFPVLTPAYPYQDACDNVSMTTLGCLCDEFARANAVVRLLRDATASKAPALHAELQRALAAKVTAERECAVPGEAAERGREVMRGASFGELWETLLQRLPFFTAFTHYIRITISATDPREYRMWVDMMESKVSGLWKEGPHNRGCALETWASYLQLRPMSVTLEEPGQAALLERAKQELQQQQQQQQQQDTSNNNAEQGESGGAASAAASASPKHKFSAYFFIGFALLPGAKIAQNGESGGIDFKRAISAFIPRAMQSPNTPKSALPPVVDIVKRADLPSWLPGVDPNAPLAPLDALPAAPAGAEAAASAAAPAPPQHPQPASAVPVPAAMPPSQQQPVVSGMPVRRERTDDTAVAAATVQQQPAMQPVPPAPAAPAKKMIVPVKRQQAEMESLQGFDF